MLRPRTAGRYPQSTAPGRRRATNSATSRPATTTRAGDHAWLDVLVLVFSAAVAIHVVALMSLLSGWLDPLFNDAINRIGQGADFFAVYGAGHNVLHGQSVYTPADGAVPYAYPFRYLPSVGYSLGAIFNLTYPWNAYWSWVIFNEVLLVVNLVLTWRAVGDKRIALIAMTLWLVFSPFYLELFLGQFSFVMASLFFWMGLSLQQRDGRGIGPAWLASLLVKTNSLLFLPLWVRFRMGWMVFVALGLVALVNLPYFLTVDGAWHAWAENFASLGGGAVDPHPGNLGLPAFLETIRRDDPGSTAAMLAGLPWGFVILAVCCGATVVAAPSQKLRLLAMWICAYFLVFAEVWEHHYVMLLPAVILLILFDPRMRPLAITAGILLALPTPLYLFSHGSPPLDYRVVDPQIFWDAPEIYIYHLTKLAPTLFLFGGLIMAVVQGDRADVKANIKERLSEYRAVFALGSHQG
jgi:hypothetical protein